MIIKATDVIGLKVITSQDGGKIEDVDDLLYAPDEGKVKALLIKTKGMFSAAKVILIEDVKEIGKDAVMVTSIDVLKKASDIPEKQANIAIKNDFLTKIKIMTEGGTELGSVSDIYFELPGGTVQEFELSKDKKRFKISDIVKIGKEAVIVKSATEAKVEEQEAGGISGMIKKTIDTVKEQAPKVLDQVKEKTQQVTNTVKEKSEEVKNNPKTQEAHGKVEGAVIEKKDTTLHSQKPPPPPPIEMPSPQNASPQQKAPKPQDSNQRPSPLPKKGTESAYTLPEGTTVTLPGGQEYTTHAESTIKKSAG